MESINGICIESIIKSMNLPELYDTNTCIINEFQNYINIYMKKQEIQTTNTITTNTITTNTINEHQKIKVKITYDYELENFTFYMYKSFHDDFIINFCSDLFSILVESINDNRVTEIIQFANRNNKHSDFEDWMSISDNGLSKLYSTLKDMIKFQITNNTLFKELKLFNNFKSILLQSKNTRRIHFVKRLETITLLNYYLQHKSIIETIELQQYIRKILTEKFKQCVDIFEKNISDVISQSGYTFKMLSESLLPPLYYVIKSFFIKNDVLIKVILYHDTIYVSYCSDIDVFEYAILKIESDMFIKIFEIHSFLSVEQIIKIYDIILMIEDFYKTYPLGLNYIDEQ